MVISESGFGEKLTGILWLFFRRVPDDGGYAILRSETLIDYIYLKFDKEDINFLNRKSIFGEKFLNMLENFTNLNAIFGQRYEEGMGDFSRWADFIADEVHCIKALNYRDYVVYFKSSIINYLIKAARMNACFKGQCDLNSSSRRAHGADAANYGARAVYWRSFDDANTYTDRHMDIPSTGTMAHSWVQEVLIASLRVLSIFAWMFIDHTLCL